MGSNQKFIPGMLRPKSRWVNHKFPEGRSIPAVDLWLKIRNLLPECFAPTTGLYLSENLYKLIPIIKNIATIMRLIWNYVGASKRM
jgi:hypothetical protein